MNSHNASLLSAKGRDLSLTGDRASKPPDFNSICSLNSQGDDVFGDKNNLLEEEKPDAKLLPKLSVVNKDIAFTKILSAEKDILQKNYDAKYFRLSKKPKKPRILVIEDLDESRNYICSILQKEHYQTMEAKDSKIAFKLASAKNFDLIICDFLLPIIDGYDAIDLMNHQAINPHKMLLFIKAHLELGNLSSSLFLIEDRETIRPLTEEKLIAIVNQKIDKAIASN